MATNIAKWEESSEIILDSEVEAPAAGWALNYASVLRIGSLVAVHIEATNDAGAASGVVCTLPAQFRPHDTVTSSDGAFTVGADGTVTYTGSRAASAAHRLNVNYAAGEQSP